MSKFIWPFIKRVALNRIDHLLAVLSLCFVFIVFMKPSMSHPQFVDCVQTRGEMLVLAEVFAPRPMWVGGLSFLYLPSIGITAFLTNLSANIFVLSCVPKTRVELAIFLICSSMQWLLIGYGIELLIKRRPA